MLSLKKEKILNKIANFVIYGVVQGKKASFPLNKSKILIGAAANSDIVLLDNSVSHYHALLVFDKSTGLFSILDLASENGVFINGKKTKESFLAPGDQIHLGSVVLDIQEINLESSEKSSENVFIDQDHGRIQKAQIPEIVPIMDRKSAEEKGLVLIDGEYCDIVFKDTIPLLNHLPYDLKNSIQQNYVDIAENTDANQRSKTLTYGNNEKSVEIAFMSMGHILDIEYLSLNSDKTYFVSKFIKNKNTFRVETIDSEKPIPFIKCLNNKIHLYKIENYPLFEISNGKSTLIKNDSEIVVIEEQKTYSYYRDSVQIVIKLSDSPPKIKATPFLLSEKEFTKDTAKVFSILMSFMLLLLLVDTKVQQPEEKRVAIIYKMAPKLEKQKTPEKTTDADQPIGVKEHHKEQKIELAKKSDPAPKPTQKESPAAPVVEAPKMAAYEFKSKSLNSLFASADSVKANNQKAARSIASTNSFDGPQTSQSAALKTGTGSGPSSMGSDSSGSGKVSSGARGLISKDGVDTTYVEPRTVILGSIDPELLRKILQEYIPQFKHCYQQELEANEAVQGIIDLHFRIDRDGKVNKVDIKTKSAAFSGGGTNCMANVLKMIDFPKPKGGGHVDVKQPLNFFSERNKI